MYDVKQPINNPGKVCRLLPDVDSRADTGSITANRLLLTDRGSTSRQTTLADSCSMTTVGPTLGQRWRYVGNRLSFRSRHDVGPDNVSRLLLDDDSRANVGPMLRYVGNRLSFRSRHDVDPDNVSRLLLDDDSRASVLPTLRYVGKRLSLRSRHDVGPDNVSRFLLDDDSRANVGDMSATECHSDRGATSTQVKLVNSCSMPIFGSTLAMSRQATVIRSRRDVGSGCVRGAHYQRYYVSLSLFYV